MLKEHVALDLECVDRLYLNGYVPWLQTPKGLISFMKHYYFYIDDADFGPAFIKVCTYAPFAVRVCLNGHEWVKRLKGCWSLATGCWQGKSAPPGPLEELPEGAIFSTSDQ